MKKKEIETNLISIKKLNRRIKLGIYCLNRGDSFLKKFNKNINSVLTEYNNIERNTYNNLVSSVWSDVKDSFENLTKANLKTLNYFWSIMEYEITKQFIETFEKLEFIKSIINREKPDIIYFSLKDKSYYEFLKKELKFNNIKVLFFKSQIDFFFHKISSFSKNIYDLFIDITHALFRIFKSKNTRLEKNDENCFIGISAPGNYYYSKELLAILDELKSNNIKYNLFRGLYDIQPFFRDIKFKWAIFFHIKFNIKHLFENSYNKKRIVRFLLPSLRDYAFNLLKDVFLNQIIRMIYIIKKFRIEIKSSNYRVIIILNEFGPEGKIAFHVSKESQIPVYFIPYCGIPRRESDVTPYLSDIICVDGELDKKYLTFKGVNSNKILVRGSPKYDSIMKKTIKPLRQITDHFTGKTHIISTKKFKILLATNYFMNEANRILLTTVVNALIKLNDIQFIIKLHPLQDGKFIKDVLKELNFNAIILKDIDILEIIKNVDVFLTEESSVILDSMALLTPVICLDLVNRSIYFSGKHVYNDEKYIIIVHNELQLYQKLNELLSTPKILEDYKNSIKNNLKLILYHEKDYSSCQTIISDLKKFLL